MAPVDQPDVLPAGIVHVTWARKNHENSMLVGVVPAGVEKVTHPWMQPLDGTVADPLMAGVRASTSAGEVVEPSDECRLRLERSRMLYPEADAPHART